MTAHRALESLVLTKEELHFKAQVELEWAQMTYAGLWFHPLKKALDSFIDTTQTRVSGEVELRLYAGQAQVIRRKSPLALYSESLASFDTTDFDQSEMGGMVKNHGLQSQMVYQQLELIK